MTIADVVIISGGIVGSSIVYHLTAEGCWGILPATVRRGISFCATSDRHAVYLRANYEKPVALGLKDARIVSAAAGRFHRSLFAVVGS